MSGGAVIRAGELVGVIQARDEESKIIAYCIPLDACRDCIGELPEPFASIPQDSTELQRAAAVFVGRSDELAQLEAALLGSAQAPVAITAVHGMAGVGKSWLADRFYVIHQHLFPGGYQRLALNAENPASAELLLAELAERLEISERHKTAATAAMAAATAAHAGACGKCGH
ncbi:MAG: ATP-binding protein [Candidatus Thiothrix singaporensis]|uniref:ATP-binding protein n=1 Tax=Candidatus Thiothrix singaporensis TaxID=2799669 RepID=A0A7L6AMH1_9GAMM|nr:MAG: ATP-binding protein [Candidatus Thiothrix singaporensis]